MNLITCQHEWVRECQARYRCEPPIGYWFEDAHYPLSKKMGGTSTVRLWYPDHIVQGVLQTLQYNYPCIFTRNIEEPHILGNVYPHYLSLYQEAVNVCRSHAGKLGAAAGFASEAYRSSEQYTTVRSESGKKAWVNKTGAFSEEGVRRRLKKRSTPVAIETSEGILHFPSLSAAGLHFNVNRTTIQRWKDGLRPPSRGIIRVFSAPE